LPSIFVYLSVCRAQQRHAPAGIFPTPIHCLKSTVPRSSFPRRLQSMRWPHRSTNGKPPRRCKNRCAAAAPSLHRRCPTSPPPLAQGRPDAEPCRCGRLRCRSPATPTTPSLSCVGPHRAAPSTASRRRSTGSSPSTPSLVRRRSSTPLKPSAADAFAILAGQLGSTVHSFFARRPSLYPRRSASPAAPVTAAAKPRRRERVAQASA
jgi:hypothetical protein